MAGATTSKAHTAIKIAPAYDGPIVQVPDASLVVGVCSELLSPERKDTFVADLKVDQERLRKRHAEGNANSARLLSLDEARQSGFKQDWKSAEIAVPESLDTRVFDKVDLGGCFGVFRLVSAFLDLGIEGCFPKNSRS